MRIKFYTNAAMEIMAGDVRILCDPWFVPGAFDGSWWHWPSLKTRPEDLDAYTHLYISHIYSDHCDPETLRRLRNKDAPVMILKREDPFLKKQIMACGFSNVIEFADRETRAISPETRVTMYGAFSPSAFVEDAQVPNVIDSSIVVTDDTGVLFNANDNVPNTAACELMLREHRKINTALLPYSGVGPYPSSYDNLTWEEKQDAAERKKEMYLNRLIENAQVLGPDRVIPCAGQMILAGKQHRKNPVLGVGSRFEAKERLNRHGFKALVLEEGDILDTETGQVAETLARLVETEKASASAASAVYFWERPFESSKAAIKELYPDLQGALDHFRSYQEKYHFSRDWHVGITVNECPEETYLFSLSGNSALEKVKTQELFSSLKKFLQVKVPYYYLSAILHRRCHWNNAYHGCHVEWYRRPDEYLPEIQTLLSYFHLPSEV